jgi:hypothetical protein
MKKTLALSNGVCAALGILPTYDMPSAHGQVCLANDSLISQATFVQEVTTFGIGYSDPNRNQLAGLRDYLAPRRTSGRNALVTVYDETEPFEVVDYKKVKREPLAEFPEVRQRTSRKVSRLIPNRGLSVRLDKDQLLDKPNWQNMHTMWLIDLLIRASILETLALYSAAAVADAWNWNANANPDLDVKNAVINGLAPATGFYPNRALYGDGATLQRQIAYEGQNNAGAYAGAVSLTDEQIATRTGLARVRTNAERYQDATGNKSTFLGKKVLLFSAVDQETPEDSSNVVRHVANASFGGGEYAVFITEPGVKTALITVENYELPVVQHTSGVELVSIN